MTNIVMPQMGESITEGTVVKWMKKVGDTVKKGETVLEIGTDKVDAEVPSPADGVITQILHAEGAVVPIETVLAVVGQPGEVAVSTGGAAAEALAELILPEKQAPAMAAAGAPAPPAVAVAAPARVERSPGMAPSPFRSPVVMKIAAEHGVDLDRAAISGSGIGGRVTKQDLLAYIGSGAHKSMAPAAVSAAAGLVAPPAAPAVTFKPGEDVRIEKMTRLRKIIAERMIESRRVSAHVQTVFEFDFTNVVRLRERHKKAFETRHGVKLTFLPFVMKAVTEALQAWPVLNASVVGDEIHYKRNIHLGVAVAVGDGLMVPVIRNCEEKNLVGMARASQDAATRARNKQISPDELSGGTFTITNPGQFGGLYGMPIINQPEVAILCFGGIEKRAKVVNGDSIAIRDMAYMALSFDHRIIDGATADQFMARVKAGIESGDWPDLA